MTQECHENLLHAIKDIFGLKCMDKSFMMTLVQINLMLVSLNCRINIVKLKMETIMSNWASYSRCPLLAMAMT